MNRPSDSARLLCALEAHERNEEERASDGVLTEEERRDARMARVYIRLLAKRVHLNERHVIQTLRIGFDNTPDHNLLPAINEYDRQALALHMSGAWAEKSPERLEPLEAFESSKAA